MTLKLIIQEYNYNRTLLLGGSESKNKSILKYVVLTSYCWLCSSIQ